MSRKAKSRGRTDTGRKAKSRATAEEEPKSPGKPPHKDGPADKGQKLSTGYTPQFQEAIRQLGWGRLGTTRGERYDPAKSYFMETANAIWWWRVEVAQLVLASKARRCRLALLSHISATTRLDSALTWLRANNKEALAVEVERHAEVLWGYLRPAAKVLSGRLPPTAQMHKTANRMLDKNETAMNLAAMGLAQELWRIARMTGNEGKAADKGREGETPRAPDAKVPEPLTPSAAAVLDILRELPPERGMEGPAIIAALDAKRIFIDQSTLTKRVIPALKPYGAVNTRGVGYYLDPTRRDA